MNEPAQKRDFGGADEDKKDPTEDSEKTEELKGELMLRLECARSAIPFLEEQLSAARNLKSDRDALANHLSGFYREIDKLAKGKTLIQVTDLIVERVNEIIRDAKAIVSGDRYLDNIKEFVPAGDNPVYPDVLMTARIVQQSLERFVGQLDKRYKTIDSKINDARTIEVGIERYLENEELTSKEDLEELLDGDAVSSQWFSWNDEEDEYFDLDRLLEYDLRRYFFGAENS